MHRLGDGSTNEMPFADGYDWQNYRENDHAGIVTHESSSCDFPHIQHAKIADGYFSNSIMNCSIPPIPLSPRPAVVEGRSDITIPNQVAFEGFRLASAFQPIVSLSLQRIVGHEALLRACDVAGQATSPVSLFSGLAPEKQMVLDCISHQLHLDNFKQYATGDRWIFLNMTPEVFLQTRHAKTGNTFSDTLSTRGINPNNVVIELLERDVRDSAEFEGAVAYFRELGCLIALDDFGAGSSNFDRVCSLRPKIVKLDRSLIADVTRKSRVRRILPQLISLLHEAGAMVLVEGIESKEEAYIALEANADLAQGYLFGHPEPFCTEHEEVQDSLQLIWQVFDQHGAVDTVRQRQIMAPYIDAVRNASVLLAADRPIEEACAAFLALSETSICYLLDAGGRQIGVNLRGNGIAAFPDPRLEPLRDTHRARWSRCPYFRRAIEHFGKVQITRPYLSISSGSLCVTVSVGFLAGDEQRVICGDITWTEKMAPAQQGDFCGATSP